MANSRSQNYGKEIVNNIMDSSKSLPTAKTTKKPEIKELVGFSNLPAQVCRRASQKPFEFSLLVVGGSGLGKSTLVNCMFLADIYKSKKENQMEKTMTVETHRVELEENGVKLSLTVVDTPGYGDAVDSTNCFDPIIEHVEEQFNKFLESETSIERV